MEHLLTRELARKGLTCMLWLVANSHHVFALTRGYLHLFLPSLRGGMKELEPGEVFSTTRWGETSARSPQTEPGELSVATFFI